jgi:hypothetical protein
MSRALPPVCDPVRLKAELARVPTGAREDAVQESWVAFLDGRDPVRAVGAFAHLERRRRQLNLSSCLAG